MASSQIKIGPYIVGQTLGVGSFGKVKLATHSLTGHRVAMKIINRRKICLEDMAGRVKREIQYLKLLRHPHIIKLYEVITTPTDIIMILEYAGGELFEYIVEHGKLSEENGRRFFQQLISAVEYCHRHNIVHRDLKPENVLLDADKNVKIADFGFCNLMTDGDFLKTSCGSPNYAAPEVISGKLYAGPEVDVWSCGVILYVMLCGRLPFDDEYIPTLFKKINGGIFSLPSFLTQAAKDLLLAMLVVDPLKRITISEIRQNAWFNEGLPDYLNPLPDSEFDTIETPDVLIIRELEEKLQLSRASIVEALADPDNNYIKVAYHLVVDHKRILFHTQTSQSKVIQNFVMSSSPPSWIPNAESLRIDDKDVLLSSSIAVLNPFYRKSESDVALSAVATADRNGTSGKKAKKKPRWHFGIRSHSHPMDVMNEIYRALRNMGMEWRNVSYYHVRVRYPTEGSLLEDPMTLAGSVTDYLHHLRQPNGHHHLGGTEHAFANGNANGDVKHTASTNGNPSPGGNNKVSPKSEEKPSSSLSSSSALSHQKAGANKEYRKFDLQLYKVDDRSNLYLVDFKNLDSDGCNMFAYLHVCSMLIAELAISS